MRPKNKINPVRDDLWYWESCRSGDGDSFAHLFRKYYQPLYSFSDRLLRDEDIARQITQNVFVDLWVKRESVEIKSNFKTYLYQMVRNQSLNHLKKSIKTTSLKKISIINEQTSKNPETNLIDKEFSLAVHRAIEKLPAKCRQVYLMKRYDHLKTNEIAKILNISVNTVKTHMKRALQSLLEQLSPHLKNF